MCAAMFDRARGHGIIFVFRKLLRKVLKKNLRKGSPKIYGETRGVDAARMEIQSIFLKTTICNNIEIARARARVLMLCGLVFFLMTDAASTSLNNNVPLLGMPARATPKQSSIRGDCVRAYTFGMDVHIPIEV